MFMILLWQGTRGSGGGAVTQVGSPVVGVQIESKAVEKGEKGSLRKVERGEGGRTLAKKGMVLTWRGLYGCGLI